MKKEREERKELENAIESYIKKLAVKEEIEVINEITIRYVY